MDNSLISLDQLRGLGEIFVTSGFFADSKDASQAIVKILAGRELGFGPIASMTGVYIVNGRPALSANLIAARIKGSGRYDYRVKELDNQKCSIEFFNVENHRAPESLGVSTFSLEDARKAGTKNLDRYPRNMLFARTLTNGARWYCPDVFNGGIYTPDELGASVDEDGSVIEMPPVAAEPSKTEPPASLPPVDVGKIPQDPFHAQRPEPVNGNGNTNGWSEPLRKVFNPEFKFQTPDHRTKVQGYVAGTLDEMAGDTMRRHTFLKALTGKDSIKDLSDALVKALAGWVTHPRAKDEVNRIINDYLKAQGQTELPQI